MRYRSSLRSDTLSRIERERAGHQATGDDLDGGTA